ncbi:MAG: peptidylprolyl isomerase [Candidatus Woesearchaeota archaeon]
MKKQQHKRVVYHTHKQKKLSPLVIGVSVLVIALILFLAIKYIPRVSDSSVLATVNGDKVYAKEIDDLYDRLPAQYQQTMTKQDLLNQTIARNLLLQQAKAQNIVVDDKEVYKVIDTLLLQNKMTREQLQAQLDMQNLTLNDMVEEYRKQLQVNILLNRTVYNNIQLSEDEISTFYSNNKQLFDQAQASHILVNSSALANSLLDQIKNGADFALLAKTYSLDTYSAQNGGDLGFFVRTQMVPEFADPVFNAKVGDLFVVQTQFGYHVVKVTTRRIATLAEASAQIKQALLSQRQSAALQDYISTLWSKASIKKY